MANAVTVVPVSEHLVGISFTHVTAPVPLPPVVAKVAVCPTVSRYTEVDPSTGV